MHHIESHSYLPCWTWLYIKWKKKSCYDCPWDAPIWLLIHCHYLRTYHICRPSLLIVVHTMVKFCSSQTGFQNLKQILLGSLFILESIVIEDGALPSLEKFKLVGITELKEVPSGLYKLSKLEVFHAINMSDEFQENFNLNRGQGQWIIEWRWKWKRSDFQSVGVFFYSYAEYNCYCYCQLFRFQPISFIWFRK